MNDVYSYSSEISLQRNLGRLNVEINLNKADHHKLHATYTERKTEANFLSVFRLFSFPNFV